MSKNLIKEIMIRSSKNDDSFDSKSFVSAIEKGYVSNDRSKFETKKKFTPSKLVYGEGKCPRYWYIAFDGANFEDKTKPFDIANMKSGTDAHERVLSMAVMNSEVGVDVEFSLSYNGKDGELLFGGICDGLVKWKDEEYVLELKTVTTDAFQSIKESGEPRDYHIEQLILYMKVLKKTKGIVLYENKNTHELFAIPVEINDIYKKWASNTFDWMEEVKDAWKARQLPEIPYRSNSKICKKCPVQQDCLKLGDGVIKIKPLEELSETMQ